MQDEISLNTLRKMFDQCTQDKEVPTMQKAVNQVLHKKRTIREFTLSAQIGEYDMDNVILDLRSVDGQN